MRKTATAAIFIALILQLAWPQAVKADNGAVCVPGALSGISDSAPVTAVPTYSYSPDGLVEFHVSFSEPYWSKFNYLDIIDYRPDCTKQFSKPFFGPYLFPLPYAANVIFRLQPVGQDNPQLYNFFLYDEATNALLPPMPNVPEQGYLTTNVPLFEAIGLHFIEQDFAHSEVPTHEVDTPIVPSSGPATGVKSPLLIIPGILGTEMYAVGEKLWPNLTKMLLSPGDRFMDDLAFTASGAPVNPAVAVGEVIRKLPLFDYTQSLLDKLAAHGYQAGQNLFTLPYDWRQELSQTAAGVLGPAIDQILASTQAAKLDVIAHSQGGLLIKRLLFDNPAFREKIGNLIFVGTPHLGAPFAAKALLYGDNLGIDFLGLGLNAQEIKRIAINLPSIYELLPSEEFVRRAGGYINPKNLTSYSATEQFLQDQGLSRANLQTAAVFHALEFDNFALPGSINISGCETPTLGRIFPHPGNKFQVGYLAGDGTVPVASATYLPGASQRLIKGLVDHSQMLSQSVIQSQIMGILNGQTPLVDRSIATDASQCHFAGRQLAVPNWLQLHIYDAAGNHVGLTSAGPVETAIPGVQYDQTEDATFVFLPTGANYSLKLISSLNETQMFDLDSKKVVDGLAVQADLYRAVPIAANAAIDFSLSESGDSLAGSSAPAVALNAAQTADSLPPQVAAAIASSRIGLSAADTAASATGEQASGLENIQYSLDGGPFIKYERELSVTEPGQHTLQFFAADWAGNHSDISTAEFTIPDNNICTK